MEQVSYLGNQLQLPVCDTDQVVYRCVPKLDYIEADPRSLLYTSGNVGRCNPEGVFCLYVAEAEETALLEFRSYGTNAEVLVFQSQLKARALLDLRDPEHWEKLGLEEKDLMAPYLPRLGRKEKMPLHELAQNIAARQVSYSNDDGGEVLIVGVLYSSVTAAKKGQEATNIALFRDAFDLPDELIPEEMKPSLAPTSADRWP